MPSSMLVFVGPFSKILLVEGGGFDVADDALASMGRREAVGQPDFHDVGPGRGQVFDSLVRVFPHLFGGALVEEVPDDADAGRAVQRIHLFEVVRNGFRDGTGVLRVVASHRLQHDRGVGDAAGHDPDRV